MSVDTDIEELLAGVAPERRSEINDLFRKRTVNFALANDRPGLCMQTWQSTVLFNERAIQQIYLTSFLAWQCLVEQSGGIIGLFVLNRIYDYQELLKEPERERFEKKVDALGAALQNLTGAASPSLVEWPATIPRPTPEGPADIEHRAAHELALFAIAYVLLHETRHALYFIENDAPGGVQEERNCDQYAFDFLMGHADQYAAAEGYPPEKVKTKRAMGVLLGQFLIMELTPTSRWSVSGSHPSVKERLKFAIGNLGLPEWDDAYVYCSSLLLSTLRRRGVPLGATPFSGPKDLCDRLLELL
jgi:hypothetical protein